VLAECVKKSLRKQEDFVGKSNPKAVTLRFNKIVKQKRQWQLM
jgi:hypothetical protein